MMRTPTPSPLIVQRGQSRNQSPSISNYTVTKQQQQQQKGHAEFNIIKRVARFVARIFFGKKKVKSQKDEVDSFSIPDQVGDLSYSISNSAGASSKSSSKSLSSSRLKHSSSYASSSTASLQLGVEDIAFQEIYAATGNFSPANIIGQGGFGIVYKGKLKNGSLIAIKRAKKDNYDQHLSAEFRNEILTLSKIEHNNLVKFFGYLEHGDERIIVIEYVSNGTLREHLDGKHGDGLEIAERLDIVIDVAHALSYLHSYSDPPIIHRDIKSSNVLVTEKLHGKVADFGFARLGAEDSDATHISTQVKGTAGYTDPEYLKTYQLTEKSDVYSFGVLLVEIVTGRYPIEEKRPFNERMTIKWALQRLKQGEVILVMDPRLRRSPPSIEAVEKVLKLARRCLAPSRQSRPPMRKCAEVLWEIRKDFREHFLSHNVATALPCSAVITRDLSESGQDLYNIEQTGRFLSA